VQVAQRLDGLQVLVLIALQLHLQTCRVYLSAVRLYRQLKMQGQQQRDIVAHKHRGLLHLLAVFALFALFALLHLFALLALL